MRLYDACRTIMMHIHSAHEHGVYALSVPCDAFRWMSLTLLLSAAQMALALRDIKKGERIAFSYIPACAGEGMSLGERRERLQAELNFTCGCDRCVEESMQESSGAVPSVARPRAEPSAAIKGKEEGQAEVAEAKIRPAGKVDHEASPACHAEPQREAKVAMRSAASAAITPEGPKADGDAHDTSSVGGLVEIRSWWLPAAVAAAALLMLGVRSLRRGQMQFW